MKHRALLLGVVVLGWVLCWGLFVLTAQQPAPSGVFTTAQAQAGRKAYENTCGNCHTPTLLGRKGDPGELPPVSSLPAYMQDMASGIVPPLAGASFINRWGSQTTSELTERINQAVGAFPPEGTNSPVPGHAPADARPDRGNQHYRLCLAGERRESRNTTARQRHLGYCPFDNRRSLTPSERRRSRRRFRPPLTGSRYFCTSKWRFL